MRTPEQIAACIAILSLERAKRQCREYENEYAWAYGMMEAWLGKALTYSDNALSYFEALIDEMEADAPR